ncbi:type II secretion system protein GspC [Parendozoicomonas haliclonae]|uniref:Type II secretion system protein C n=1 Tax=Parendozoicomonas haliclonae TaxID=1960125 RepID=A0A1X7AH02_9GAMM|nr:type II secretion system protein GspC [Parendozoicomonas haliclonae]SMA40029.1 Type II secretion system protein C [Parendozoicomonas haliclonae]
MFTKVKQALALRRSEARFAFVIEVVLVVILAHQLASLFWVMFPAADAGKAPAWSPDQNSISSIPSSVRYSALDSLEIFGPVAQQPVRPAENENVPASRIKARITGMLVSNSPEHSLVILKEQSRESSYRVGEKLKSANATIIAIEPGRVIVETRGRREAILFAGAANQPKAIARNVQPTRQVSRTAPELKQGVLDNPGSLMEMINISPVKRNGELVGYRVNPGSRPELFDKAGLQRGDIALSINGYDLTSQKEAMAFMQNLPGLNRISLTVERQGQIYQIDLST